MKWVQISKDSILEKILKNKFTKLLGLLALGGLGSGFWQIVIYPILSSGVDIVLNISTLGLDSLRDNIYRDTEHTEFLAVRTYTLLSVSVIAFLFAILTMFIRLFVESYDYYIHKYIRLRFSILILGSFIFIAYIFLSIAVREAYALKLSIHLDRLEVLCDSVVSNKMMRIFKSERVQIDNRSEYLQYEYKLQSLVNGHDFEPLVIDFF